MGTMTSDDTSDTALLMAFGQDGDEAAFETLARRDLQGQDFRRIGEALGTSEDAAQMRTSHTFDCLNQLFKRKAGAIVP